MIELANYHDYEKRNIISKFSSRMKYIMDRDEITQHKLSEMTGISQGQISKYINCSQMPSLSNAVLIANALSFDLGSIYINE